MRACVFFIFCWLSLGSVQGQLLREFSFDHQPLSAFRHAGFSHVYSTTFSQASFPYAYFELEVGQGAQVFIGDKFWFQAVSDTLIRGQYATLWKQFPSLEAQQLRIFCSGSVQVPAFRQVSSFASSEAEVRVEGLVYASRQRDLEKLRFQDNYVLAMLLLLFFLGIYRVGSPGLFGYFFSVQRLWSGEGFAENQRVQKFLSWDILLFLWLFNSVIALGLMGITFFHEEFGARLMLVFSDFWPVFFFTTSLLFGFSVAKFFLLRLLSFIFGLGQMEFNHFFYLLRVLLFLGIFLMASGYTGLVPRSDFAFMGKGDAFWAFLGFYGLGVISLGFQMINVGTFKKYHIIAYLCSAELIPALIVAKLLIG
ncbi:MAG: DUF4271 domain-containing protein [Nitritalea sp.]